MVMEMVFDGLKANLPGGNDVLLLIEYLLLLNGHFEQGHRVNYHLRGQRLEWSQQKTCLKPSDKLY